MMDEEIKARRAVGPRGEALAGAVAGGQSVIFKPFSMLAPVRYIIDGRGRVVEPKPACIVGYATLQGCRALLSHRSTC